MKTRMLIVCGLLCCTGLAQASGPVSVAPMMEVGSSGNVPAAGDTSRLTRMANGDFTVRVQTSGLDPSTPYTVWSVIFNRPEFCQSTPCTGADFPSSPTHDPRVEAALVLVTGGFSDASGNGHFFGRIFRTLNGVSTRPTEWGIGLLNPFIAQIHIVVRSHGQPAPADANAALNSFNGGCNAENAVQPPCLNEQLAIHLAQ